MDNATYNQVASVIQNAPDMQGIEDPTAGVPGMPPQWGAPVLPQIITFQGLASTISRVYRPSDEAIKDSWDNARFMLNDVGIMECLQARQRSVALLDWTIEPEDTTSPDQKELATEVEKIIRRIPRFMQWLENNQHAIWFGRSLVQHRYRWGDVDGKMRVFPHEWYPVHGDKLAFRIDDGTHKYPHNQIGIRVGQTYKLDERIGIHNTVEPTDRGMAYFLTPDQRKSVALHKHYIMDGAFEDPLDADKINGVGIRSVIYWEWYQKQQALAWLMEYLERSAFGIELWFYPEGNPGAKEQWIEASKNRIGGGRNMLFVPRPTGSDGMNYGVERIEPGLQGADVLTGIIEKYYGHRIKRYILGQTLTSEADATGLGSGLAELHLGTFLDIIKYDATNLEETATNDLVKWVQLWNFPDSRGIRLYFKLKTDSVDKKERLEAIEKAWNMGARVKETDALDAAGLTVPNDEDRVLPAPGAGVQQAFGKLGDAMGKHQQSMEASLNESLGADDTGGTDDRIPPETEKPDQFARGKWDEASHPRGQPENAGEFAKGQGAKSSPKDSPGKKFAKEPARKGEMSEAKRIGKGKDAKIIMADGKEAPAHITASMVPPGWSHVQVSVDPHADVLVTGRDAAGRPKTVYSDRFHMRNAALKFSRVSEGIEKFPLMFNQNMKNRDDERTREEADCTWLMMEQATRPGSDTDTKAKVKAYGATTLLADHVVESPDGVRLQFVGKEGVHHDHLVRNPDLAKMLLERKRTAGERGGKLFATNYDRVAKYAHTLDGGSFSPKDWRTIRATRLATELTGENPSCCKSAKEYKSSVNEVAKRVSSLLGNKPAQALESYINPTVFSGWQAPCSDCK